MVEEITLRGDALAARAETPAPAPEAAEPCMPDPNLPGSSGVGLALQDGKARRALIARIGRYKALFPDALEELREELAALPQKTEAELAALLDDVIFMVETCRSAAQARGLFVAGMSFVELGGPYFGLQLRGLAGVCSQSADLLRNVDEVALKHQALVQLDPVARLAIAVGQLCLAVDAANRRSEAPLPAQATAPVHPLREAGGSMRAEFADL